MKKLLTSLASVGVLSVSLIAIGCGETDSVTKTTEVETPKGTATVTEEKKVETTGEAPPVVAPAETPATPATP
ncbi:hypothetical protein [Planctomyces sp. SH-PL62]|uniref:hypothetical protein n=1 Tax=Planctomyces sp. SH-PL62 TaxID=1636152 RepID=UPI00078D2360|nr:hypothetical protein [Planctomyces sp. SH-PL62]AMV39662.1 hypothetical protein VT85_19675 [Planctomyces sp. SH-PL62]